MTQKIPNSLVTISKGAHREEVEGTELVGRASIKRLWQGMFGGRYRDFPKLTVMTVFTTSRQASKDDTHRRLEYLFWRIWSSDHLTGRTDLQALDHLITRIMAAEPLHSTPIELPKVGHTNPQCYTLLLIISLGFSTDHPRHSAQLGAHRSICKTSSSHPQKAKYGPWRALPQVCASAS